MDGDRDLDFDDIEPFVLALQDPLQYQSTFGVTEQGMLDRGDTDVDGDMDFDDIGPFVSLLQSSGSSIPEPTTLTLWVIGVGTIFFMRSTR